MFLVPKAFFLAVPVTHIRTAITDAYPAVSSVDVERMGTHGLLVTLQERERAGYWCDQTQICYSIDKNGFVYAKESGTESGVRVYRGPLVGGPIGGMFGAGTFAQLDSLIAHVADKAHVAVSSVTLDQNNDVTAVLVTGGEIRFVRGVDENELLINTASVFDSAEFKKGGALEYADFRFGGKALVKFKK